MAPAGPVTLAKARPWATVLRVPLRDGTAWFKACRPVEAFEPRLTAGLSARWPDRVVEVLDFDADRAWLLTADAGAAIGELGNDPATWLRILPRYAELQRGETRLAADHVGMGVPDLRTATLPVRYDELLACDLPIEPGEIDELRRLRGRFAALCAALAEAPFGDTIQHGDLHLNSVFARRDELRILDWGDASIAHPFFSLVVPFQFLRDHNGMAADDPWFGRLRDAYLEPWGSNLVSTYDLADRVGTVAHAFTWLRHRDAMPVADRRAFDELFPAVLRRALGAIGRS